MAGSCAGPSLVLSAQASRRKPEAVGCHRQDDDNPDTVTGQPAERALAISCVRLGCAHGSGQNHGQHGGFSYLLQSARPNSSAGISRQMPIPSPEIGERGEVTGWNFPQPQAPESAPKLSRLQILAGAVSPQPLISTRKPWLCCVSLFSLESLLCAQEERRNDADVMAREHNRGYETSCVCEDFATHTDGALLPIPLTKPEA
jgi:hypothetical protein